MPTEKEKKILTRKFKDRRGFHQLGGRTVGLTVEQGNLPKHVPWDEDLEDDVLPRSRMFYEFNFAFFNDVKPFGSIAFKKDVVVLFIPFLDEETVDFYQRGI